MNRQEILLKEYEVSQQHINSLNSQVWQSTAIFLSVNALVVAYVFQKEKASDWDSLLLTLVIGAIFILVLNFWKRWINRARFNQGIIYERMRDIEDELGMWKNWYIHILDGLKSKTEKIKESDLNTLPKEKASRIKQMTKSCKYAGVAGFSGLQWIARLLMISWGFLIIREIVNCFFPQLYQWLPNIIN